MSDDDFRLRRRLGPGGPRRSPGGNSWLITILAAIVVIAIGWFAGMLLARYSNRGARQITQVTTAPATPTPSPTAAVATPSPSAHPSPSARPSPSAHPSPTPHPSPTAQPTAAPAPVARPSPTVRPTLRPATPAPTARRQTQPVGRRPEPVRTAAPIVENAAASVVRSYIDALRRGDPQAAAVYLANGSPDEGFIGGDTHISSLTSTRNADGSYSVAVRMQTSGGPYLETFIVAGTPNGDRILNKSASKL